MFLVNNVLSRIIATVVLLYLTAGLWMYYIDAKAFTEAVGWTSVRDGSLETAQATRPRILPHTFSQISMPSRPAAAGDEDIFIVFRTSATTIWRRVPMYLSTLLAPPRQFHIYSDYVESIGGTTTIDSLDDFERVNASSEERETWSQLREFRRTRPDLYWELGSMDGDTMENAATPRLDKYKFFPALQHAYNSAGGKGFKWYLVIEDDSFIFWHNLRQYLQQFDHTRPLVLGHEAWRLEHFFPHGGSGMVLSSGAMDAIFGNDNGNKKFDLQQWQDLAAEHDKGDHLVGMLLQHYGIALNDGHGAMLGFEPSIHHEIKYSDLNWNAPILSVHKVHQRDIAELSALEASMARGGQTLTYGQLFRRAVWPHMMEERECWNNKASEQTSSSTFGAQRLDPAALSRGACKESCAASHECLMWRWDEDTGCHRDTTVALGAGIAECEDISPSGWMRERISRRLF